jgi:hypothetical protein
MDIYNDDLQLDPDKAAAELRALPAVSNKDAKRESYVHLQTAALIDIADSLRTLAVEAAVSMADAGHFDHLDDGPDNDPESVAVIDAPAGTKVRMASGWEAVLTGESGVDQGAAWVGVRDRNDTPDAPSTRAWVEAIVEVIPPSPFGDERDADAVSQTIAELAASAVPLVGVATGDPEPVRELSQYEKAMIERGELVEEWEAPVPDPIDADFEGDDHSRAEAAVAALKAREKKATKKGKKS